LQLGLPLHVGDGFVAEFRVPSSIWCKFINRHGGKFFTVALRLADGRELDDVRVDANGVIVGMLYSGVAALPLFTSDQIVGVRSVLSPWIA
jgi:hypothetical protein